MTRMAVPPPPPGSELVRSRVSARRRLCWATVSSLLFASLLAAVSAAPVGAQQALGWKRPPETATVRFGGHGREVNVKLPVPPGVHANGVTFTISDGTAQDHLTGSCSGGSDYDNRDYESYTRFERGKLVRGTRNIDRFHHRDLHAGGSVSVPVILCSPSVGKNFKIHWGDASQSNVEFPETSYDPDAPNCKAAQQVIPARPYRAPRLVVNGQHGDVRRTYWDPGDPGRARQVKTVSWTCFTTVTVLASSGGGDGVDSVSAQDDPVTCDAGEGVRRARAAFEWHLSYGSNAAMFWRILNTLGADDLPAKPPGVADETISAQEASDFSSGNGWAGWPPINDALQRCTTPDPVTDPVTPEPEPEPDPVTSDPDPVTPEPEPEPVTPDPDPEVSVAAGGGVTEGGDAVFTVTAVPAPSAALSVDVSVSQSGDFGVSPGTRTVTVPTSGSVTLTVATADDSTDEADGKVTATVGAGSGYTVSPSAGTATVAVSDDDDPPPPPPPAVNATPSLAISDATAGEGGTLTFTVTLSPASSRYAWVNYYARPEHGAALSATYADFAQAYGMLTFKPGETSKTITVAAVDDSSPESDETFKVVLYSAVQAAIADGEATGTITDND